MPVHRLNHAVLFVRDAARSASFYIGQLGFRRVGAYDSPGGVFLQAEGSTNDHDLALFTIGADAFDSAAGRETVGLYHLSWEVDTLADLARLAQRLETIGSLVGASNHGTTRSLYAKDPDGIEFELTWVVPAALLTAADTPGIAALDLAGDIERFGGNTLGGVGISRPAPSV